MSIKLLILSCTFLFVPVVLIHSQENQICTGEYKGELIEYFKGEIAVKFNNSSFTSDLSRITNSVNGNVSMVDDTLRWAIIKINDTVNVLSTIDIIDDDPSIENVVPKMLGYLHTGTPPNDYYFADKQWYLKNTGQSGGTIGSDIKAVEAWDITNGSQNVIMAILDSGIPLIGSSLSLEHPDLDDTTKIIVGPDVFYPRQNLLYNGDVISYVCGTIRAKDYECNSNPKDEKGHGSHVAGLAGAETNNFEGIAGIGRNCKIMIIQTFGKYYSCYWNPIEGAKCETRFVTTPEVFQDGVNYVVNYARSKPDKKVIINFSGGFYVDHPFVEQAVRYAYLNNILIVASAGNSGGSIEYPAAYSSKYPNVIAVGATNHQDKLWEYSSRGTSLNISAPGGDHTPPCSGENCSPNPLSRIWSTWVLPEMYKYTIGTSMAVPLVTGTAALIYSVNPALTSSEVRNILQSTADKVGSYNYNWDPARPGHSNELGYGRLNAYNHHPLMVQQLLHHQH